MAKSKTKSKALWIGLGSFIGIIILILGIVGGKMYMDKKREEALYKHGFRLLEEQLATYIKEHYEGVSRIEFSPIFEDGGDGYSMYTLNVVVAISDEHGNRALVDEYGSGNTPFGTANGLTMDFDGGDGSQVIELDNYDRDEVIDVSDADTLPKNAKLESYRILDEMIQYLVKTEQLVDVKKSNHGSRDVKVVYNTTIKKGSYSKWH